MINGNFLNFKDYKQSTRPINPNKVSIFHYNDTHGNSDEMSGVLIGAKKFKNDEATRDSVSFVLSGGDNYSGADTKKNEFFIDVMQNLLNVDASAVGNHEIDGGSKGFFEAADGKKVNFVATNVVLDEANDMNKIVKKSYVVEKNGVKYGFVGTMPLDLEKVSKSENTKDIKVMQFDDTVKALQNEVDNLKKQGINRIILLSHVGYDTDKKLASSLDGVDIIISGHSHSLVEGVNKGENWVDSKSGEPVLIVQAGENGKYYGIIDVEFDNKGLLKNIKHCLQKSVNRLKSPILEHIKTQKVGKSPKVGNITNIDAMPSNRRVEHCQWTSVLADSMRTELNSDIALINSANVRKVPKQGTLTENDISESVPMKNKLLKTKITQKDLVDAIKNSAKATMSDEEGVPGLLQVSGLTYKIDDMGNLLEMNFVDKNGNKTPIDINNPSENITYTAVYDDFAAKENGEYPELFPKFDVKHFDFDKDKTMIDYLNKMQDKEHLDFTDEKRIEIVKTQDKKQ